MTDAGGGGGGGGQDAAVNLYPCKQKVTSYGSGHHNPGQNCLNCHAGEFSLAGTLYSAGTGGSVIAGASITVKDASGASVDLVTQANGNFYTTQSFQFPVTLYASECQIQMAGVPMTATVSSSNGGCNMSGCHTTSAQGRIHLP